MTKRGTVLIPLLLTLSGCSDERAFDPCEKEYYRDDRCRDAVAHGGYFYRGVWRPTTYRQPYTYYQSQAHGFAASGGRVVAAPSESYSPSFSRGGFGASGEAEGSGHGGGGGE